MQTGALLGLFSGTLHQFRQFRAEAVLCRRRHTAGRACRAVYLLDHYVLRGVRRRGGSQRSRLRAVYDLVEDPLRTLSPEIAHTIPTLAESSLSLAPVLGFLFALQLVDTYKLVTFRRVLRT